MCLCRARRTRSRTLSRSTTFSRIISVNGAFHISSVDVPYSTGSGLCVPSRLRRVVSLILSHDKPKSRARQIEKFIDIANRLRNLHNYSGLRAIIAGINSATFEGDESLELLRTKSSEHWKNFQQWDQLLQSVRSHQKYRMALRNTKGACIPAL